MRHLFLMALLLTTTANAITSRRVAISPATGSLLTTFVAGNTQGLIASAIPTGTGMRILNNTGGDIYCVLTTVPVANVPTLGDPNVQAKVLNISASENLRLENFKVSPNSNLWCRSASGAAITAGVIDFMVW